MRGVQQGMVKSTTSENFFFFAGNSGKAWSSVGICLLCETFWIPMNHAEPAHPSPIFHGPSFQGKWCLRKQPKIMLGRCPQLGHLSIYRALGPFFLGIFVWGAVEGHRVERAKSNRNVVRCVAQHSKSWMMRRRRARIVHRSSWTRMMISLFWVRVTQSCFKKCLWYNSCTYYSVSFLGGPLLCGID